MPFDNSPAELPAIDDLDEVGRTLMRAADIVDVRWCQDSYGVPGGPRCAAGALLEVTGGFPGSVWVSARDRLSRIVGNPISRWNDTKGRTAAEVSAAMRAAARTRP